MRTPLLAALLVAVAFAGCAGSDDDGGPAAGSSASASMTTTGPPPKPVVYSDALHLLEAPEMAVVLPPGGSEFQTGTAGDFGFGGGGGGGGQNDGPPSTWSYQLAGYSNVTSAEIHVWIDIKEQLVQGPPFNPNEQACTWYVRLALGADSEPETHCKAEPVGVIAPGIKEVTFEILGLDSELEANETIEFVFGRTVFSTSQNDAVYVVSGSEEHDSRIVLKGLKEVVAEK